ncbi:ArsR/SmtB family transcription factor [Brevibacterium sp. FME37]|uniref:ArsR/SmtB family transcription factor n=1 Tax=Brevibacterium sp. FME37 TaxID=2742607 RepID=UPI001867196E|nr:helix-turn-helix domain-containing protein [Brevibacterium sp. FME37]
MQKDDWINPLLRLAGSKERLLIISFLASQKEGVHAATISTETGIRQTTLSRMLRELEDLGYIHGDLAQNERRGRAVRYSSQPTHIRAVLRHAATALGVKL